MSIFVQNTGKYPASISIITEDEITNQYFTIEANSKSKSITCRPGNTLKMGSKEVAKISAASKNKVFKVTPLAPALTGMKTRWSGDDAWKEWDIYTDDGEGNLKTRWSGDDAWKEWAFSVPGASGTIKTRWSGDDAWKEWQLSGSGNATMKTRWSGEDAWKEWEVSSAAGKYIVKTRWSGEDAWREWEVNGKHGKMIIKTRWSGDDAWKEWQVTDSMNNGDLHLKVAAIFVAMYAGALGHTQ